MLQPPASLETYRLFYTCHICKRRTMLPNEEGGGLHWWTCALAPSSSLVPIETNVEGIAPSPSDVRGQQPSLTSPETGAVGQHSFDGRYTLVLPTTEELNLRHGSWAKRRAEIRAVMGQGMAGRNRLARWDSCGAQAMLHWHKSGQYVLCQAFCCHDRFCVPCSRSRSRCISENLSKKIDSAATRFVTLTLSSDDTPLSKQLDRLYRSFRTLRADEWWSKNVSGGCSFLEVTINPKSGQWHPHLHPLIQGSYLPQAVLSRKWFAITGNSPIVDIRAVPCNASVCLYVSKYASKCLDDSVFTNADKLSEMMCSMGGRRFCLTFGAWRGWKILEHTPLDMSEFKPAGSLTHITKEASLGDSFAIRTLNALRKNLRWEALNPNAAEDALYTM